MDRHYRIVKTVRSRGPVSSVDLHEFHLTPNGTALLTAYQPRFHHSLWVLDSVFQEIDPDDGRVLFEWSALDHVNLSESHVARGSYDAAGDGRDSSHSWDFFHMNSVDKTAAGDYLISSRHFDCIFKISGTNGSILWRLHGDQSSFRLAGFSFRRQHHARVHEDNEDCTMISLFDNDSDGFTIEGPLSRGLVIEIDHHSRLARTRTEFRAPGAERVTPSMGSLTILPDRNVFVGWGDNGSMAEYYRDGSPAWFAQFGLRSRNYRAFKADWLGEPLQPPALSALANSSQSSIQLYVSWNGATQVQFWHFYASDFYDGPYQLVGSQRKTNFETTYIVDTHHLYTYAEAVGAHGSLRNSSVVRTSLEAFIECEGKCIREQQEMTLDPKVHAGLGTMSIVSNLGGSVWPYLKHLMVIFGVLACFTAATWILCPRFRPSAGSRLLGSRGRQVLSE